ADAYRQIAKSYPDSEWADLAAYRVGECHQLESRGPEYDERPLYRAAAAYRRYLATRPHGERRPQAEAGLKQVEETLARGELARAQLYVMRERDHGARIHFANVALAYPSTKAAEEARSELSRRGWDLSLNSIDTLAPPIEEEGAQ